MLDAARSTRTVGTEAEKLAKQRSAFTQLGTAGVAVGALMLTGAGLAVRAAMQWESAWAGVTKTVDGTPAQLAAVEQGLRDLTGVLPASHQEIAAVAEAAGQLGIQTGNVVAFTRTMIDLGETTNLSAEQAAMSLARLVNIMGTSQSEVSNLGAALVGLGNSYATTESEILAMSMRLAKSGVQIGLSEGEVLGLATALSSVGIEAEAGGSAMSKVMIDIAASVSAGGDRLEQFARISGMSGEQFAKQWKTAPGEALAGFVQGLANAESKGTDTLTVLAELGITEVRMRDALLGSAAAADQFAAAMGMGNSEFAANNALAEEAAKRYETVESKLALAGNAVNDAAISFGGVLAPMVGLAAEKIAEFSQFITRLPDPLLGILGVLTGVGGAFGVAGGLAFLAIPKIAEFRDALETMGVSAERSGRLVSGVGKGLAIAGVVIGFLAAVDAARDLSRELTQVDQKTRDLVASNESLAVSVTAFSPDTTINDWSGALTALAAHQDNVFARMSGLWDENMRGGLALAGTVEELGKVLGTLATSNLPDAQARFRAYADEIGATGENLWTLINASGDYRDALVRQIEMDGLVADRATITRYALGEAETGFDVLAAAAAATEDELDGVKQALDDIGYTALAMGDAVDRAQAALNRLGEAASAEGASLTGLDDASIRLRDSMRGVEESHRDAAIAILDNGGTLDDAIATYHRGRDAVVEMMVAKGEDEGAARTWADANMGAAADAESAVRDYATTINKTPARKHTEFTTNADAVRNSISLLRQGINALTGKNITITQTYETHGAPLKVAGSYQGNLFNAGKPAAFYAGGFPSGIYAGRPGGIHKFAEPELPWEAYISPAPEHRARNLSIWQETGRRLGVDGQGTPGPDMSWLRQELRDLASRPSVVVVDGQVVASTANRHNQWGV